MNVVSGMLLILVTSILMFPEVKAVFIRSLMKIGFFQPDLPDGVSSPKEGSNADYSDLIIHRENGEIVNTASLKGKVVFVNFWATWCPPCIARNAIHRCFI